MSIKLGNLWWHTDARGSKYLTGEMNDTARIFIFPNRAKINPTDPDFTAEIEHNNPVEKRAVSEEDKQKAFARAKMKSGGE